LGGSSLWHCLQSVVQAAPDNHFLWRHIVLTWPSNAGGFDFSGLKLHSAPVTGTFTNIPSATSPYTNPIAGARQFCRSQ
jgi:hypothetical protein